MKAFQLTTHGRPGQFQFLERPLPEPGPDEVRVRVRACGLNHLDLWTEAGELPIPVELPRIPGCEPAGEVESIGAEVADRKPGDRVAVQSNLFCGTCEFCIQREESLCLRSCLLGVQRDGGFAENVVVPARCTVPLPPSVGFEEAAAVTLAGSTAMHMLTNRTRVVAGSWVLVTGGASGVGSSAIQIARELGAYVIASASTEAKREFAAGLGAQYVLDSTRSDWASEVRRITQKRGVDVVVEHLGGEFLAQAFQCLARGGTIVTCGATTGREVQLNLWPFFVKQHRLIGSYGRNRQDMKETLDWVARGALKPTIDRVLPLDQAGEGFASLRRREIRGKVIIRP